MSLISLRGLSVRYGAVTVLRDVSMEVAPGEIVTVVGPNGSGKTSLLRAIIGAVAPARGEVVHKPGLRIGYVPQRLHIDPTLPMTVERFLRLPGGIAKGACAEALETAGALMKNSEDWSAKMSRALRNLPKDAETRDGFKEALEDLGDRFDADDEEVKKIFEPPEDVKPPAPKRGKTEDGAPSDTPSDAGEPVASAESRHCSVYAFPGSLVQHRPTKVTQGTRYSLVGFYRVRSDYIKFASVWASCPSL